MQLRITFLSTLLACFLLPGFALGHEKKTHGGEKKEEETVPNVFGVKSEVKEKVTKVGEVIKNSKLGNNKEMVLTRKKTIKGKGTRRKHGKEPRNDIGCTSIGGICQSSSYVCQGRYLKERCALPKTHQCCMPAGAWSVLCASHHNNRVRACDMFGCGSFNSRRDDHSLHKAVDVVCEDYGLVNAPFTGTLRGPVVGVPYDGVMLSNSEYCLKIFNIRPYRYMGPISRGEVMGYLLPMQERFSGITSHMELQMCDRSDPSPYI
ncbi:hypothetical protein UPYG_G00126780 [Umbra pygmaea]|uniref:Uncharacterized protein n=1 Tax=Umbra pygmaea TaxID=75934 RepID=A0ABD0X683_UMBPY